MPSVLLATCAAMPTGDDDAAALTQALAALGVDATWVPWTSTDVDWGSAPVVLRSTWDYHATLPAFLDWTSQVPRLSNPAEVVRWNTDKRYVRDLQAAGVPTIESSFADPGERVELPDADQVVVKPSVGAGSRGAGRFTRELADDALAHARALQDAGRTVVVQPYLDAVETAGETALLYFDGRFSHAIRKGPMLREPGANPLDAGSLFVPENITARVPEPDELEVGALALAHVRDRFGADQLYTRVDLLPSPDGPVVVELELTEPSLFLGFGADADVRGATPAEVFAAAIAVRT